MKLKVFNWMLLGLALAGVVGFFVLSNKIFLVGAVLFGVWFVIDLAEHFIRNKNNGKVLKMVKE